MDKMKKGIRCNEVRFTNGDKRDRIRFEFVSDDGVTPSSCTVCVGDIDPITGEKITDLTFFREYYRVVDHEVHQNLDEERREQTKEEKAWRKEEKKRYCSDFEKKWGYKPSKDNVLFRLEQGEEERYHLSLSVFINEEDGTNTVDWIGELSYSEEMDWILPVEMQALKDVAASLNGRKAEVYQAMIQRAAGGQERIRFSDIAKKWGVSCKQIHKDQGKIMEKVRKRAAEIRMELQEDM